MFKSLTAFLLIFTVLTANFSKLFIYAGFELNQNYITSKLCENRDKPEMHCNGKCYLAKKIKQAEQKERNQERESQKNHFQEAFLIEKTLLTAPVRPLLKSGFAEPTFNLPRYSSVVFQPPKA
ncbi:hypothetical protein [Rubrolithibacter danxiaensis]|uniref:hypothetical protein n=1 Tax=Rubrolithibacter danxiaensis TaxID=3390805 RepID=UPI003BF7844F